MTIKITSRCDYKSIKVGTILKNAFREKLMFIGDLPGVCVYGRDINEALGTEEFDKGYGYYFKLETFEEIKKGG